MTKSKLIEKYLPIYEKAESVEEKEQFTKDLLGDLIKEMKPEAIEDKEDFWTIVLKLNKKANEVNQELITQTGKLFLDKDYFIDLWEKRVKEDRVWKTEN